LVPESPTRGARVAVPGPIRDRIIRFHLANGAKRLVRPWRREDIRSGEMALTLVEASPETLRLRLDGSASLRSGADAERAESGYTPRLVGLLEYDVRRGQFRRFDFVALGECWGSTNDSSNPALCGPYRYTLGIAFELSSGLLPSDRLPPSWLWQSKQTRKNREEYFGRGS